MTDLTEYLAGVKALADKATKGPWKRLPPSGSVIRAGDDRDGYVAQVSGLEWRHNAAFITASRGAVSTLHAMVEAVLELHAPIWKSVEDKTDLRFPPRDVRFCSEGGRWPCPTVRAMTAVLDRKEDER